VEVFLLHLRLVSFGVLLLFLAGCVGDYSDPYYKRPQQASTVHEVDSPPTLPSSKDQPVNPPDETAILPTRDSEDSFAVVVGISEYSYSGGNGLTNLLYADDDALAFRDTLVEKGWDSDHIKCLIDDQATKKNVEEALAGWLTKAGKEDLVVFFWSGHAYPDPSNTNNVYFACYDTDVSKPYTGWRMDKVVEAIKEVDARNVVVIADTCHAGKLITKGDNRALAATPYVERLRQEGGVPPGWIYLVSAEPDRKAIENSKWSNGAFSYCLINGLSGQADVDHDGNVTMLELKAYMGTTMPEETEKVLGKSSHPIILTNSTDTRIWNITLNKE